MGLVAVGCFYKLVDVSNELHRICHNLGQNFYTVQRRQDRSCIGTDFLFYDEYILLYCQDSMLFFMNFILHRSLMRFSSDCACCYLELCSYTRFGNQGRQLQTYVKIVAIFIYSAHTCVYLSRYSIGYLVIYYLRF